MAIFSLLPSCAFPAMRVNTQISLFYKDTSHVGVGSTLRTSFYLIPSVISKQGHILTPGDASNPPHSTPRPNEHLSSRIEHNAGVKCGWRSWPERVSRQTDRQTLLQGGLSQSSQKIKAAPCFQVFCAVFLMFSFLTYFPCEIIFLEGRMPLYMFLTEKGHPCVCW